MLLRLPLAISALALAVAVLGQDKQPLYERMSEAEKNCVERIRRASPESDTVARQSMNTCRQERQTAEETDLKKGNQEAQLRFIQKYSKVDTADIEVKPVPATDPVIPR
jgi:hypothetical protein